jgi:predicted nucleotidyltransferase
MKWTQATILDEVEKRVKQRVHLKHGVRWKRTLYSVFWKLQKKICYKIFGAKGDIHLSYEMSKRTFNLGEDFFGRDIGKGMLEYVRLLKKRGVMVHTVIVLGSRAKGGSTRESDVDVLVIAKNLPGRSYPGMTTLAQKILGLRRWFLLSDRPLFIGVQPSGSCSSEEFLQKLENFDLMALDAIYYGKIIYDDGFWLEARKKFKEMEEKYNLEETPLKQLLLPL